MGPLKQSLGVHEPVYDRDMIKSARPHTNEILTSPANVQLIHCLPKHKERYHYFDGS